MYTFNYHLISTMIHNFSNFPVSFEMFDHGIKISLQDEAFHQLKMAFRIQDRCNCRFEIRMLLKRAFCIPDLLLEADCFRGWKKKMPTDRGVDFYDISTNINYSLDLVISHSYFPMKIWFSYYYNS